jgi:hypothetical protein
MKNEINETLSMQRLLLTGTSHKVKIEFNNYMLLTTIVKRRIGRLLSECSYRIKEEGLIIGGNDFEGEYEIARIEINRAIEKNGVFSISDLLKESLNNLDIIKTHIDEFKMSHTRVCGLLIILKDLISHLLILIKEYFDIGILRTTLSNYTYTTTNLKIRTAELIRIMAEFKNGNYSNRVKFHKHYIRQIIQRIDKIENREI